MVKKNAITGIHTVCLAVVNRDPVGIELGDTVGAARVEGGGFPLGDLLYQAVELRCRSLVDAGFLVRPQMRTASRTRRVPRASTLAVYSGASKLTAT